MLALMVLHIILHWKSIAYLFRRLFQRKQWRMPVIAGFAVVNLILLLFLFFIKIEVVELKAGAGHQALYGHAEIAAKQPLIEEYQTLRGSKAQGQQPADGQLALQNIKITGKMTLRQVSETYHVPIDTILNARNIRGNFSGNERLGPLRKQFGFYMQDVEEIVSQYQGQLK